MRSTSQILSRMRVTTGNHGFLRQQNLAGVLQRIHENAPVSRIELARSTGLNKATISSLVSTLLENRFVRKIGEGKDKRAGRREVLLDLDPARGCMISAEIGVGFISVICTDFKAAVIGKWHEPAEDPRAGAVLEKTIELLKIARGAGEKECGPLQGLAVGIPGLIDHKSGKLLLAPNLGWRDLDLLPRLAKNFEVPLFIDNEATFAALGERYFGVARGHSDVLYISAGVGIGGGLIIGGQIFNGAGGFASEFGHMGMDPAGARCGCGNTGCWETQASQAALFRYINDAISTGEKSIITKKDLRDLSVETVLAAAEEGDAVALAALGKTARYLAAGIDSLVKAFDPEIVVFGGIMSLAGRFLMPVIEGVLAERSILGGKRRTTVHLAQFGSEAAAMGGIAKIFQSMLANPAVTNA
jgi:glucokinase-like ROK family protein